MSLRQGPDRHAVNYDDVVAAGMALPADRLKPAPAAVAAPVFDVAPLGTFAGRTAAESRALALSRKTKIGVSTFAMQINNHWCVVRRERGVTTYLEG